MQKFYKIILTFYHLSHYQFGQHFFFFINGTFNAFFFPPTNATSPFRLTGPMHPDNSAGVLHVLFTCNDPVVPTVPLTDTTFTLPKPMANFAPRFRLISEFPVTNQLQFPVHVFVRPPPVMPTCPSTPPTRYNGSPKLLGIGSEHSKNGNVPVTDPPIFPNRTIPFASQQISL